MSTPTVYHCLESTDCFSGTDVPSATHHESWAVDDGRRR